MKTLINGRWQLDEFLFIEYRQGECVLIDIGPFPENPDVEETDKAFNYLTKLNLPYLSLNELNWTLELPKFSEVVPETQSEKLGESLSHPPAFETARIPEPREFLVNGQPAPAPFFLRLKFDFEPESEMDLAENDSTPPSDNPEEPPPIDYPKIIS